MPWDPRRYHQFQKERFAPFEDLLRLIKTRSGLRVVDLGCGTGELTRRLADHLPESDVVGLDASREMLEQAQGQARLGLRFQLGAIEDVDGEWDLVFSHAALQWVADHRTLMPRLLSLLPVGGQLAVQVPSNFDHATYGEIRDLAGCEPFRDALNGWVNEFHVLPIREYADLLHAHGAGELNVFEKIYPHVLEDADAMAAWMQGTALVPYFDRLPKELHERFLRSYRERLRRRFPERPVFYGFNRTLIAATRVQ